MIARLHLQIPFRITVPEGVQYRLYRIFKDGYHIVFGLPGRSDQLPVDPSQKITIDGVDAFQADIITIDFAKESFERSVGTQIDPPEPIVQYALDYFLSRLKYVTKGFQVKPINFPLCQWNLAYLNDDGSELDKAEGFVRSRASRAFSYSIIGCDPAIWDSMFSLPAGFEPPVWHTLLLDSRAALPHIGSALVLAATALEVFIAELLENLVTTTQIPDELWKWVNKRGNWLKDPSVNEKFDALLNIITGHSLKDDNELWEGLKNIKDARNSFAHEGVAKLGRAALTVADTAALIEKADMIILKIRDWIPEQYQWPVFNPQLRIEITQQIIGPPNLPSEEDSVERDG